MQVNRFGLGLRFRLPEAAEEAAFIQLVWENVAAALTAEDVAGLQIFGGMQDRAPDGSEERYYLALFTGGGLKQTRRVYEKLDASVKPMLCPVRPYLENNALLRVEGLACLGQIGEDGSVSGGEESIPGLRFIQAPAEKRRKRR